MTSPLRRLLWASAMVDDPIMVRASRLARRKYEVIGTIALLVPIAAGVGWTYKATRLLGNGPLELAVSVCFGLFAFLLLWSVERLLIATVRPGAGFIRRMFSFLVRLPLAAFAALVLLLPFGLKYFESEVAGHNYDRRLRMEVANERAIEQAFGLPTSRERIDVVDRRLSDNEHRRSNLPADVRALDTERQTCVADLAKIKPAAEKTIGQHQYQIGVIRQRINTGDEDAAIGQQRINWLNARIGEQRQLVTKKEAECVSATSRFVAARDGFYAEVAAERKGLIGQREVESAGFAVAHRGAMEERARSTAMIDRRTGPGLAAEVTGIIRLARTDPVVMGVLALYGAVFFLIEMLAILAKVTCDTDYDRRLLADEQRRQMEIEADLEFANAEKAASTAQAKAMIDAEERFHNETRGQPFMELARVRTEFQARRLEVATINREIEAALSSIAQVARQGDDAELRLRRHSKEGAAFEIRSILDHFLARVHAVFRRKNAP